MLSDPVLSKSAVFTLGLLSAASLKDFGQVGFYVDPAGMIALAPLAELALDAVDERQAMQALLQRGYGDEKIIAYLKGRQARRDSLATPSWAEPSSEAPASSDSAPAGHPGPASPPSGWAQGDPPSSGQPQEERDTLLLGDPWGPGLPA
jgi:hypothetical protein